MKDIRAVNVGGSKSVMPYVATATRSEPPPICLHLGRSRRITSVHSVSLLGSMAGMCVGVDCCELIPCFTVQFRIVFNAAAPRPN